MLDLVGTQNCWFSQSRIGSITIFRYDPSADIHGDTDTEQDRIIFIKSVAEFMVSLVCEHAFQVCLEQLFLNENL